MKTQPQIQRVMHPLKIRHLQVSEVELKTPHLLQVILHGEELQDFVSASPDDHVKVFFPDPETKQLALPTMTEQGPQWPEGSPKPPMRDYTPRAFNNKDRSLTLQFYLHDGGVGATWAKNAQPGQSLVVAGPRGSQVVPYEFDWYLLVGDESSLPSVARRLEELPADTKAVVFIEVEDETEQLPLVSSAQAEIHWIYRRGTAPGASQLLQQALLKASFPTGDYFSWISAEQTVVQQIKEILLTVKGAEEAYIKATAYWRQAKKDSGQQ